MISSESNASERSLTENYSSESIYFNGGFSLIALPKPSEEIINLKDQEILIQR
ncbi:hypothetical protein [Ulvibacter antarcticus]|uniref:Uncharacterized protein n=1 Tax=Ulvibacter antarcticus TaxID=442714 RepID=A0A3L9Z0H8_9FLAO|nr:hypothetical protein [Ulvibacter antarcticus]RMA64879.1 hypothetical protein BXY75_1764 [Ulvibacter antarcticus]